MVFWALRSCQPWGIGELSCQEGSRERLQERSPGEGPLPSLVLCTHDWLHLHQGWCSSR